MFICVNCMQFVEAVFTCDECRKNVCDKCILKQTGYFRESQLCSKCQCAGCALPDDFILSVGYKVCGLCGLQYCDECFKQSCGNLKSHIK